MADDLYDQDFYLWTRAQAAALRGREAGANSLDYDRLAEEVEDLGSARRNKAASYTLRVLQHLYKLEATRNSQPRGHWLGEIGNFRAELELVLTPSIRRELEEGLERLHLKAARIAQDSFRDHEPEVLIDAERRWSLAEILDEDHDRSC